MLIYIYTQARSRRAYTQARPRRAARSVNRARIYVFFSVAISAQDDEVLMKRKEASSSSTQSTKRSASDNAKALRALGKESYVSISGLQSVLAVRLAMPCVRGVNHHARSHPRHASGKA